MDRFLLIIAFSYFTFLANSYVPSLIKQYPSITSCPNGYKEKRDNFIVNCIGTVAKPAPEQTDERYDSDNSWRTPPSTIVPFVRDKYDVRPEIITFDAVGVLIEPSQSIGRWYREVLNSHCDMRIRLPRPALFTAAFKKSYSEM